MPPQRWVWKSQARLLGLLNLRRGVRLLKLLRDVRLLNLVRDVRLLSLLSFPQGYVKDSHLIQPDPSLLVVNHETALVLEPIFLIV